MKRGDLPHRFFDAVARYQYAVADAISVQTPGDLRYFQSWAQQLGQQLEVLSNWLDKPAHVPCSIRISDTA